MTTAIKIPDGETLYRAACLSGGGIRGVFQIEMLKEFEKREASLACDVFDLLVGGSVGAIDAGIVATGKHSALELSNIYYDFCKSIFKKKPWYQFPKLPLYDKKVFIELFDELIGLNVKMGDVKTKLMVGAINAVRDDLGNEQTRMFKSWHEDDAELPLYQVIVASFSAAAFFGQTASPERRMVFRDPGQGFYNFPIDFVKAEAEVLGWYSGNNHVLIDAIGTLYDINPKLQDYDYVSKQNNIRQVLNYWDLKNGGEASAMATSDQIRKLAWNCKHNDHIHFRLWNEQIASEKIAMDKIQYFDEYASLGRLCATKFTPLKEFNC